MNTSVSPSFLTPCTLPSLRLSARTCSDRCPTSSLRSPRHARNSATTPPTIPSATRPCVSVHLTVVCAARILKNVFLITLSLLVHTEQAARVALDSANRWTDNVFTLQTWSKKKFEGMDGQLDGFFKQVSRCTAAVVLMGAGSHLISRFVLFCAAWRG